MVEAKISPDVVTEIIYFYINSIKKSQAGGPAKEFGHIEVMGIKMIEALISIKIFVSCYEKK